jgi:hypothetical protein
MRAFRDRQRRSAALITPALLSAAVVLAPSRCIEPTTGQTTWGANLVAPCAIAGTLSSDPVALFAAVSGLRQAGLEADARRLVEAALGARL